MSRSFEVSEDVLGGDPVLLLRIRAVLPEMPTAVARSGRVVNISHMSFPTSDWYVWTGTEMGEPSFERYWCSMRGVWTGLALAKPKCSRTPSLYWGEARVMVRLGRSRMMLIPRAKVASSPPVMWKASRS